MPPPIPLPPIRPEELLSPPAPPRAKLSNRQSLSVTSRRPRLREAADDPDRAALTKAAVATGIRRRCPGLEFAMKTDLSSISTHVAGSGDRDPELAGGVGRSAPSGIAQERAVNNLKVARNQ